MKFIVYILLLLTSYCAIGQSFSVTGNLVNEQNLPVSGAIINVAGNEAIPFKANSNKEGAFLLSGLKMGKYSIKIIAPGKDPYTDSFKIETENINIGTITIKDVVHMLDEVKVAEKVLAMVQKDDTLEYNSGAVKVNPDADGADLIRKMPAIDIIDKKITVQGEAVVKILVDGKPFFGNDPYAALKNLPADVIDKVKVYNEKSDQEQFTGFNEGPTRKTINIITKINRRIGLFGKVFAGGGGDPKTITKTTDELRYGTGATLNKFNNDQRITLTLNANNVNAQNFTESSASADGSAGTATSKSAGINYSDKWGKKTDISGSYFFNKSDNTILNQLTKTYVSATDSGQIYTETRPTTNQNKGHRMNLRMSYNIDSLNSILITPGLSVNNTSNSSYQRGSTKLGGEYINKTDNRTTSDGVNYSFSNNLLFRHKFQKKKRTFSLSINTNLSNNQNTNAHIDTNSYYTPPPKIDTINQKGNLDTRNFSTSANASYTEPVGKNGLLKLEYNASYDPTNSDKQSYNYNPATNSYDLPNVQFSNSFQSENSAQNAGSSYQLHLKKAEFSFGINYQITRLNSSQSSPTLFKFDHSFSNFLPVATLHYKLSKSQNLQISYNTSTQAPTVFQLQNVVNNTDPLHLYAGNPDLKQSFRHIVALRFNSMNKNLRNNLSLSLTGNYTEHSITQTSIIAHSDSTIFNNILLHTGSQLTIPVNINGNTSLNANMNYGMPLKFIKSQINVSINAGMSHIPGIINNQPNYQENRSGGLGISLSSNISENIDFLISSNTNYNQNKNSINSLLSSNYLSQTARFSLNLISNSGLVFNTSANYQSNSGLSAGYDQNYLICNASIGKKVFKKKQGDIRLSVYDLLNENNNIQHTVSDVYVSDSRSNILQRYFLLVFTYKISSFKSNVESE